MSMTQTPDSPFESGEGAAERALAGFAPGAEEREREQALLLVELAKLIGVGRTLRQSMEAALVEAFGLGDARHLRFKANFHLAVRILRDGWPNADVQSA
jgi:hypothetical protein